MGLRLTAEDRHHLTGVVDALARRFEGRFSRETVERFVNDSLARFENARITMHLPVLAERVARRRLEALVEEEPLDRLRSAVSRTGR
jgi:hypothetical protein